MKISKAIILAAGLGTRFLPATKAQAKEMLPIVDKPCIQYLVEEAVKSGVKEIIFIINAHDKSIKNHFSPSPKLKDKLKKKGMKAELKEIERIEKLAKFKFVIQRQQNGDGHAILQAKHLINKEPCAVLFGDDLYDSKTPATAQLIKQYQRFKTPIIGLHKIEKRDCKKYGMVTGTKIDKAIKIKTLVEKPSKAPSSMAIIGKYILTPGLLKTLAKSKSATRDKELRLIDGLRTYIKDAPIHGYNIEGQRFDTGDKLGYLKAVVYFATKSTKFRSQMKKYLRALDF